MQRFQLMSANDPNWQKLGLASIYPHQGYRYGINYYMHTTTEEEGLSDAVTLLRRHDSKTTIQVAGAPAPTPAGFRSCLPTVV
ncbi:MAG: hypothetical protein R3A45_01550 [Bdellovibrionota bacterium]